MPETKFSKDRLSYKGIYWNEKEQKWTNAVGMIKQYGSLGAARKAADSATFKLPKNTNERQILNTLIQRNNLHRHSRIIDYKYDGGKWSYRLAVPDTKNKRVNHIWSEGPDLKIIVSMNDIAAENTNRGKAEALMDLKDEDLELDLSGERSRLEIARELLKMVDESGPEERKEKQRRAKKVALEILEPEEYAEIRETSSNKT